MSNCPVPAERQPLPLPPSDVAPEMPTAAIEAVPTPLVVHSDAAVSLAALHAIHGENVGAKSDWILMTPSAIFDAVNAANAHNREQAQYWRYKAEHDKLTGLVNQGTWHELLEARVANDLPTGVLTVDLNSFKMVNDTLGHGTGDELLAAFGLFLHDNFKRESDTITGSSEEAGDEAHAGIAGRTGGDEFQILVDLSENNRRGDNPYMRMDRAYEYLEEKVAEFVAVQPDVIRDLGFNVAIGAAVSMPLSGLPVKEQLKLLLDQADQAMYEHKESLKTQAGSPVISDPRIVNVSHGNAPSTRDNLHLAV